MEVTIQRDRHNRVKLQAEAIEVARLVASTLGYHVDIEPGEPGKCRITAQSSCGLAGVSANGTSVRNAAEKLIELLIGGRPL